MTSSSGEFEQLLQICHLQYRIAHLSHLSPPLLSADEEVRDDDDVIPDVDLDQVEHARKEGKVKLSQEFDELSTKLMTMNTINSSNVNL